MRVRPSAAPVSAQPTTKTEARAETSSSNATKAVSDVFVRPADRYGALRDIAKHSLEANIHSFGGKSFLSAGKKQFKSLWTRDFCWSAKGLIAAGRPDVVEDQLGTLLSQLRTSDNLLPRTMDSMDPKKRVIFASVARVLPFIGAEKPLTAALKPEYEDQHGQIAIDGNVLVLLTALDYVETTGDTAFWKQNEAALVRAFKFYDAHLQDGLVRQPEFSDWQDSVKREGASFYTNLLYQVALQKLQSNPAFGITPERVETHRQKLEATFFDSKTGMYKSLAGREQFSLDGNLLAIDLGYLPKDSPRAKQVYDAVKASPFWTRNGTPGFNTYPNYPSDWRNPGVKAVGLGHYHDEIQWSWLMALSGKVAANMGDEEGSRAAFDKLQGVAKRDGVVGEIYRADAESKPWTSWLYRSEEPFSWGAAMTLYALE